MKHNREQNISFLVLFLQNEATTGAPCPTLLSLLVRRVNADVAQISLLGIFNLYTNAFGNHVFWLHQLCGEEKEVSNEYSRVEIRDSLALT